MNLYKIQTKDIKVLIKAKSRGEAFGKFFKDIVDGKLPLSKIGNIVILNDGKEDYPFRVIPSLFILGFMDEETAIANIKNCIGNIDEVEAGRILYKSVKTDKWIYKAVHGREPSMFPPIP